MNAVNHITAKAQTKGATKAASDASNSLVGSAETNTDFSQLLESLGQELNPETVNALTQETTPAANEEILKLLQSEVGEVGTVQAEPVVDPSAVVVSPEEEASVDLIAEDGALTETVPVEPQNMTQVFISPNTEVTQPQLASDNVAKTENLDLKTLLQDMPGSKTHPAQNINNTNAIDEVILNNPVNQSQMMPLTEDQVMVKNSAVSRSPAIDFDAAEVDHKLLNFDDFVAQKNAVNKKVINGNGYGVPQTKSQMPFEVLNKNNSNNALDSITSSFDQSGISPMEAAGVPAATIGLNQALNENSLELKSAEAPKVMHMDKNQTADQVISDISNYIAQVKASKEPTVQMRVQHDDLGMLDIVVNKSNQNMINVSIATQTNEAKTFFNVHQKDLLSSLTQSGLHVNEFKLENSTSSFSSSKNGSESSSQFSQSSFAEKHFGSEQNQRRSDSQRREELWDILREQEVA